MKRLTGLVAGLVVPAVLVGGCSLSGVVDKALFGEDKVIDVCGTCYEKEYRDVAYGLLKECASGPGVGIKREYAYQEKMGTAIDLLMRINDPNTTEIVKRYFHEFPKEALIYTERDCERIKNLEKK